MNFEEIIESKVTAAVRKVMNEFRDMIPPEFYTPEEVALKINIDPATVRRWCRDEEMPYYKLGKFIRIDPKDFIEFCKQRKIKM